MGLAVVTMKQQTIHRFNDQLYRLWPGQVVEIDEADANRWAAIGLAEKTGSKATPIQEQPQFPADAPARRDVLRTDLRIASMHGDTRAAVALLDMGEVNVGVSQVEGTPPPVSFSPVGASSEPSAPAEAQDGPQTPAPRPVTDTRRVAGTTTTGQSARGALGR